MTRWFTAAVSAISLGFMVSDAMAGESQRASVMLLNDVQLDDVTAAGSAFVGIAYKDEVLAFKSTTIPSVCNCNGYDVYIEAGKADGLFVVVSFSRSDIGPIPPPPFPQ